MLLADLKPGECAIITDSLDEPKWIGTLIVRNSRQERYQMIGIANAVIVTDNTDKWECIEITQQILEGVKNATEQNNNGSTVTGSP